MQAAPPGVRTEDAKNNFIPKAAARTERRGLGVLSRQHPTRLFKAYIHLLLLEENKEEHDSHLNIPPLV